VNALSGFKAKDSKQTSSYRKMVGKKSVGFKILSTISRAASYDASNLTGGEYCAGFIYLT
jgi:hypothetical protein